MTQSPPEPIGRARSSFLIGLVAAIILTFSMSVYAAHHTGKGRMKCTKCIIFVESILISGFTIVAMVMARRPVQEALLTGLLEFLIGFALVVQIHEFI